ncbi:transcriptional regulator [bacterium LRH843]|nr:transcriptional regulator [bacterium LRH843]
MDQHTLKISSVLSDPTRFAIYQYITKKRSDVIVQEVADHFSIHPNVARMHLSKLVEIHMIVSDIKKTGKGGRPSRSYRLSNEVVQLQFPFRDYERLAKMALESLMGLGEVGARALKRLGFKYGRESAEAYVRQLQVDLSVASIEEKVKVIEQIAENQGLNPEINYEKETDTIMFSIYNCTFNELVAEHSSTLCSMHQQLFHGIFSYFFGDYTLEENKKLTDPTAEACSYTVICLSNE